MWVSRWGGEGEAEHIYPEEQTKSTILALQNVLTRNQVTPWILIKILRNVVDNWRGSKLEQTLN